MTFCLSSPWHRYIVNPLFKAIRHSELQIKSGNRDNSELRAYFSSFSTVTYCDASLELSQRDGSNEGSQYMNMFLLTITENYL